MRLGLAATLMVASLTIAGGSTAQIGPYLSDLPKLFPAAYRTWTQALPYARAAPGLALQYSRGSEIGPTVTQNVTQDTSKTRRYCLHRISLGNALLPVGLDKPIFPDLVMAGIAPLGQLHAAGVVEGQARIFAHTRGMGMLVSKTLPR